MIKRSLTGSFFALLMLTMVTFLFAVPLAVQAATPAGCPAGITNYWPLDELLDTTFSDEVGVNDGACTQPGCPFLGQGIVNYAREFDGVDDGIDVLDTTGTEPFDWADTDSFSIEFWMEGVAGQTCSTHNEVVIGRIDNSSPGLQWWVGCSVGGEGVFFLQDTGGTNAVVSSTGININEGQHHVVAVRDYSTGEIIIYVDGVEINRAHETLTTGFGSTTADLNIGWLNTTPYFYFNGTIDEVALYNKALTSTEVSDHYKTGSGKMYCDPVISASPASWDFGSNIMVGSTTSPKQFLITNIGIAGTALQLNINQLTGTGSNQFLKKNDTCSSTTLTSNSCTIDVAFSPTSVGSKSANLSIPSNDPQTPTLDVSLIGTGTAPGITVTDSILPDNDNNMAFPDTAKGMSSAEQTVTIGNSSSATATLNVSNIQITGADASEFTLNLSGGSAPCGSANPVITQGGSCTVGLTFSPQTTGAKSANLQIDSDDPNNVTVNVALIGTGTVPGITVSSLSAFPDTTEGIISAPQTVTIVNTGLATLNVSNIQITGADATEFTLNLSGGSAPCGSANPVITQGGSCTVGLTFSPQTTGAKSANLQITSDDPNNPTVDVALSGTGLTSIVNNAPSAPILVSPANNATGLGTTVDFTWQKSTDPDGDTVSYKLYYCEDQTFTGCQPVGVASVGNRGIFYAGTFGSGAGLLLFGIVFAGGIKRRRKIAAIIVMIMIMGLLLVSCGGSSSNSTPPPPTNQVTHQITGLNAGSQYYWKVVADDGNGGRTDSAVWSFTTK
ncbi:hypothetical protein BMS3Abin07_02294 [bacterium BMS3Abin07]|nr:hypothetical protein BMS3Abin07_02294 [bacterium BMS3Abin07]